MKPALRLLMSQEAIRLDDPVAEDTCERDLADSVLMASVYRSMCDAGEIDYATFGDFIAIAQVAREWPARGDGTDIARRQVIQSE
jgi:hypothetical protein